MDMFASRWISALRVTGAVLVITACIQGGNGQVNTSTITTTTVPPLTSEGSGSGFVNTATSCNAVSQEFQFCLALGGRMSSYQYEQFIPQLNGTRFLGSSVQIVFSLIESAISPPPPSICKDLIQHIMCYAAAPPCDPTSDLVLPICNDSCRAFELLLASDLCLEFNNSLEGFVASTGANVVQVVYELYVIFDCANSSTYNFREGEHSELAPEICTSVFAPSFEEQLLSHFMCVPVPTGLCTLSAKTGFYTRNDRDAGLSFLSFTETQFEGIRTECTSVLVELACNYAYVPCNPDTGRQLAFCQSACPIIDGINRYCFPSYNFSDPSSFSSLPDPIAADFTSFNCSDPSTYLTEGVPMDMTQCIDLEHLANVVPTDTTPGTESTSPNINVGGVIAGSVVAALVLVSFVVLIIGITVGRHVLRKRKEDTETQMMLKAMSSGSFISTTSSIRYLPSNGDIEANETVTMTEEDRKHFKSLFSTVLVPYAKMKIGDYVGEGAFGKVYRGEMQTSSDDRSCEIAIKTIKNLSSQNELNAFLSESLIMKDFNHPNVLGLVGVCFDTPDDVPYIILPFMINGSLKDYLKDKRVHMTNVDTYPEDLELKMLVGMCIDIAHGMDYLAEKKFVHRDLAARNCMVSETLAIKVGDFGLARDVYSSDYYRASTKSKVPVKWMPPETLHDGISNEKTDVWSFGVTCWEVFSLGRTPYPGVENYDMVKHISSGGRLERPTLCPEKLYPLLVMCWGAKPEDRPTFNKLIDLLEDYYDEELSYVNG